MLWGAVGSRWDAAWSVSIGISIRARYGPQGLTHYEAWLSGEAESAGMASGDVQMLREVAETVIEAGGRFDPEAFSQRLMRLLDNNRGIGNACDARGACWIRRTVVEGRAFRQFGRQWRRIAGRADRPGLGVAPQPSVPLSRCSPVRTAHAHPSGRSRPPLRWPPGVDGVFRERLAGRIQLDGPVLLRFLADLIDPLEEEAMPERRQRGERARLCDRIRQVEGLLLAPPEEALLVTWNGSFASSRFPPCCIAFCIRRMIRGPARWPR